MIESLDLDDRKNVPTKDLSGGMKRRVCIGIALIGNSRIVFLGKRERERQRNRDRETERQRKREKERE